jgi:hypothetical protein
MLRNPTQRRQAAKLKSGLSFAPLRLCVKVPDKLRAPEAQLIGYSSFSIV